MEASNDKLKEYEKHYSNSAFSQKIANVAKKAGLKLIYLALLLFYALNSPTISLNDKILIYAALGYFISPIDIIPDAIPVFGYTDDLSILISAFERIKHNISQREKDKAKNKLNDWFKGYDSSLIDNI